jgi:formylglycine-generating enzyme required for sulfatase activity
VDVQFPWEDIPYRHHDHKWMSIGAMYVDKHPVTNADYAAFLNSTGYTPKTDAARWLKHWHWENENTSVASTAATGQTPAPPPGHANRPVTYVSLADARAYCANQHKRLPHVYEWQYFAQGFDQRTYPWGNDYNSTREAGLIPAVSNNFTNPGGLVG